MGLNFLKNREIKNAGWIIGEQIFQMLISLVVGVLTARYLGPSNYGALNYTASFVSFVLPIANLGMEGVVIKKIIEKPEDEGVYLGSCMVFRIISSLLSIASIIVVVWFLNIGDFEKLLLLVLQSAQLIFKAMNILDSWFQRYLKSKYVSIGKMIACIVVSIYKIVLLATSQSIYWFAVSNTLTDFVIVFVLIFFYHKNNGNKLSFRFYAGKEILKDSYHFILSGIMTAIYSQMDKIMIGGMLTDSDVGLYTTATTICTMWIFVPTAVINSFRPKIMELKQSNNEGKYILRLEQLYSAVIWMCLFVAACITVFAKLIIFILYGSEYIEATNALQIVVWCETFAMIGTARGIWILCENKNKYVKYYLAIGAVVNLVLNMLMIPLYGIEGAAIATLITQIMTSLIAPLLFKETRAHTKIVLDAFLFRYLWKK